MKLLKLALAGLVGFLLLCGPHPASGADSRDPSIAAGQAALRQGMEAAKRKNWPLAIKHYTEAQKRIHLSPQIMHNLALAHAQAGNELLADAWFRAYLGAVPQAANADEVRAEIARLEKATEEKVQTLFKQAEDLAEALPLEAESTGLLGRRAYGFASVAGRRIAVGDFKGVKADLAKINQYSSKEYPASYNPDSESAYTDFGTTLAEAGDVERALRARDKLKNGDRLTKPILKAMLNAGDLEEAKKFIKENKVEFDSNELAHTVAGFARKGDYATAEEFLKREKKENSEYGYRLLAKMRRDEGNLAEARRYARLTGNYRTTNAIKGEIEKSLRGLENEGVPALQPYYAVETVADILKTCLWSGDTRNAQKAIAIGAAWIAKNGRELGRDGKAVAEGYLQIGRAYLDVENGKAAEAVKRIQSVPFPFNLSETDMEILREAYPLELKRNLCDFAIRRGKLEAAERIADSFTESRERIEFLRQVLAIHETKADRANAERLTKKLTDLLADMQLGWDPENPGREFVVNAWTDAALELSWGVNPNTFSAASMKVLEWMSAVAVRDLKAYISETRKNRPPDEMPFYIAYGARTIGKGLLKVRFMDRIYR